MNRLRTLVRWSFAAMVPGELVLMLCLASGVGVPDGARRAVEAALLAIVVAAAVVFTADYRRHRRSGLPSHQAARIAVADTVPAVVRKLVVHEFALGTSFLRWVGRRGPHGVRPGAVVVPYAGGQMAVLYVFLFVSIVETVALALLIPWPVVHAVTLVLDLWGVYFVIALHASCVVRPHVIGVDGSLQLRYGALLDIRIPAGQVVSARRERRYTSSKVGTIDPDGGADLPVASETTVTVQLAEPLEYVRVLGRTAQAQTFRFYADDPAAALDALRARIAPTCAQLVSSDDPGEGPTRTTTSKMILRTGPDTTGHGGSELHR